MIARADSLTPKQHAAVLALLGHGTIERAAAAAGCNEKTLRRWLKSPDFRAAYLAARRDSVDHAVSLLQQMCGAAVLALGEALRDGKPGEKIKAATVVLDMAIKGIEVADLAAEVDRLKSVAEKRKR